MLAVLNGVVGDHLVATGNPLALAMRFRRVGQPLTPERRALAEAFPDAASKLVVLLHGLCMSDLQWMRQNHDHGAALAHEFGYTPVYLSYNSGLHVSTNGRAFADSLEALVAEWPVEIEEFVVIGHSMGGLVARSACRYAEETGRVWRKKLNRLVFLGTPHHGAPLERIGNWVDVILGKTPYVAGPAHVDPWVAAIRRCRGDYNRLGHALMLCYLRYPGRPLKAGERPPRPLLFFIAEQIDALPEAIDDYLAAERTRRRHAAELQDRLGFRPFGTRPAADLAGWLLPHAVENDRLAHLAGLVVEDPRSIAMIGSSSEDTRCSARRP